MAVSGTPDTVSTTAALADVDEVAAAAFIEAWEGGDTATMRRLGYPEAVTVALVVWPRRGKWRLQHSTQQFQCIVAVSTGTRMYLLVGEPGAPEGQVWVGGPSRSRERDHRQRLAVLLCGPRSLRDAVSSLPQRCSNARGRRSDYPPLLVSRPRGLCLEAKRSRQTGAPA